MSDHPRTPEELTAYLANMNEETRKFVAEQHKLMREAEKFRAEEMKLWRDWKFAPWLLAISVIGAVIGGLIARHL